MKDSGLRLEKSIFWNGINGHEPGTMKLFSELIPHCNWFIDIGANTGIFSLYAQSLKRNLISYAFEPVPDFFNLLRANNDLNGFSIKAEKVAASNQVGKVAFYLPQKGMGNAYSATLKLEHYFGHQQSKPIILEVETIRLDHFFSNHSIEGYGCLKVDAEGNDFEVIEGLGMELERLQPIMIVENRRGDVASRFLTLPGLKEYLFFAIADSDMNILKEIQTPVDSAGRNILFIPKNKISLLPHKLLSPIGRHI